MSLLLSLLFFLPPVLADSFEWVTLPKAIPVFARPESGAPLLVMTTEGERVAVRQRGDQFTRVQVKREGKWRVGYVLTSDFENPEVSTPRGNFAFGLGGMFTYLHHAKKEFETDDQVQYTTDAFSSSTFSPFLTVQYGQRNFWRLQLAYRTTEYSSSASTDVPGAAPRELSLEHTMISGELQKVWTPFVSPALYFGGGFEIARAIDADLVLGGVRLPVASSDLPTYIGGHLVVGGQLDMARWLSAYAELRTGGYFNQSPVIMSVEGALGFLFWP